MFRIILAFLFTCTSAYAAEQYPVDICFMVADLKYSAECGVTICEVQNGIHSSFKGNRVLNRLENSLEKEFISILSSYLTSGWMVPGYIIDGGIRSVLHQHRLAHKGKASKTSFLIRILFAMLSNLSMTFTTYLRTTGLFLPAPSLSLRAPISIKISGIVVIDKGSFPFWIDKYKMSQLFAQDEQLSLLSNLSGAIQKSVFRRPCWQNCQRLAM